MRATLLSSLMSCVLLACTNAPGGGGGGGGGGGSSSSGGGSTSSGGGSSSSGGGSSSVAGPAGVGAACTDDAGCAEGTCITTLPGGYCTRSGCTESECPSGSTCFQLSAGGSACFLDCTDASDCRVAEGYTCDADNTCYPGDGPLPCSAQNPTGFCADGLSCQDGTCQMFACTDSRHEPNDSLATATPMPTDTTHGLNLCDGDRDWFTLTVSPGHQAQVGVLFNQSAGDLEFTAHDSAGACLGGRIYDLCSWTYRGYETGEEFVSVLNAGTSDRTFAWQLRGYNGASNVYSLMAETRPVSDGVACTPTYTQEECEGRPNGTVDLMQFPHADPADPYVGDGYRFDSDTNYRWIRRELMMLVRYAIHGTQQAHPGTRPLGLIDMCQRDGITPGYDINDPRHPESTHDQGGNIDIAYYTTLADGPLGYSQARIICGPTENNQDGSFCTEAATTQHVVDLPRQVRFMTLLLDHPRLRVIGVDKVIHPLLLAEADRQLEEGLITQTQRSRFNTKVTSGDGWPFHHHHIHVSMAWWGSSSVPHAPESGCGFDLVRARQAQQRR